MPGGLNFSGFESDYASGKKSNFRKAGDAFTEGSGNTINNSSVGNSSGSNNQSAYANWMSSMSNMNSDSNNSNNSNTPPGWTPKSSTNDNASNPAYINTKDPNQTWASQSPVQASSTPAKTDRLGNSVPQSATSGMTEGQKMAQNVRPEYAEQAAKFYDQVDSMNLSEDVKGNVLTYMGGDAFLPDPEKVKAKWQEEYADRPELLGNIMTYMGGGAGNVGHNR